MACDSIWVNGHHYDFMDVISYPFFYRGDEIFVGPKYGFHGTFAEDIGINYTSPRRSSLISNKVKDVKKNSPAGIYIQGRIYTEYKLISFWNYPTVSDFIKIINLLEEEVSLKIWNNDWKVEIYKKHPKESRTSKIFPNTYEEYLDMFEHIPVEKYKGGGVVPEEFYLQHLQSPLQKQDNVSKRFPGYAKKKLAGQLPDEMEVAARARMYQEKLITKFKNFASF